MKAAMIGMGRLGLPVALAWATKHDVVGFDVSPHASEILATKKYPHREPGAQKLLDEGTTLRVVDSLDAAVAHADIVFVSVQTPHGPEYEGITRMPEERADFDYETLKTCVEEICLSAEKQNKHVTLVVISTVLPGTSEREILPIIHGDGGRNPNVSYVYAPMFIAQSTVVEDTMNPEFVLLGVDKSGSRGIEEVREFFEVMHSKEKLRLMSAASAEATKIAYNTFLGLKIVAINAWMEIAHKTGANVDEISDALAMATDRVISSKYMRAGMGDGGACHCRDQIALSHLAERLVLSYDLGGAMTIAREKQTEWLADLAIEESRDGKLPIVILGKAYKKGTNLTTGSPAILLKNILDEYPHLTVHQFDPHVDSEVPPWSESPHVFVVATDHDEFFENQFHPGDVVIDPWGKMPDIDGVKVIRVGRS